MARRESLVSRIMVDSTNLEDKLAQLEGHKAISAEQYAEEKAQTLYLCKSIADMDEKERLFLKKMRRAQNQSLGVKVDLERVTEKAEVEARELEGLEKERERLQKELDDIEHTDTVNKYKLTGLERNHADLLTSREQVRAANQELIQPVLKKLQDEITSLTEEYGRQSEAYTKENDEQNRVHKRYKTLCKNIETVTMDLENSKTLFMKEKNEPRRISKQGETVTRAGDKLREEIKKFTDKITTTNKIFEQHTNKKAQVDEAKFAAARKLELYDTTMGSRISEEEAMQRSYQLQISKEHELKTQRLELELEKKSLQEELRHCGDAMNTATAELEQRRRLLAKKQRIAEGTREILPALKSTVQELEETQLQYQTENKRLRKELEAKKAHVQVAMAHLLNNKELQAGRKEELQELDESITNQEAELTEYAAEDRRQNKMIAMVTAQRDMMAREAAKASRLEREARQTKKLRELTKLDLTKGFNDTNRHLTEFSSLYDVVKKERNGYVNLIQNSVQALAEMKEKLKILNNEVEILLNESQAKDRSLVKAIAAHSLAKSQRDQLRMEMNKTQQLYRTEQLSVKQQIGEVKSLNLIINSLERDMLRMKQKYEEGVEQRNVAGITLIDRNDELCILYEKANTQEATFARGEREVVQREQELRMLKIRLAEIERQQVITRKELPQLAEVKEKIGTLGAALSEEKETSEQLSAKLEDPSNKERWRALGGEDPELDQLEAKMSVLEARLEEKKVNIIEKELVLEEITTLTTKLRNRAHSGRDDALALTKRLNSFQNKIRDVTRKLMATVSELSMSQAMSMKLQKEHEAKEAELRDAEWRVSQNAPPTDDAEREWHRGVTNKMSTRRKTNNKDAPIGKAVSTTADQRPNAYVPNELGIPKPYGSLAPFKPSVAGSTMYQHMRNPEPREIEI